MIIFFNTWLPEKTEIFKALIKVQGIGKTSGKQILDYAGVCDTMQIGHLSSAQISKIKQIVDKNFYINQELRSVTNKNLKRLSLIGSYRGLRHSLGLPSRGQRTHSNAKTCKKQTQIVPLSRKTNRQQKESVGKKK